MTTPRRIGREPRGRSPGSFLFVSALAAGALLAAAACGGWGRADRCNLLLVTIDTLRYDRLGCTGYGKGRTPVLDRLAKEGVLFDDCIVPCPLTLPCHGALMTGRPPHALGLRENRPYALPGEAETLAEALSREGYATAAVVSGEPLAPGCGLEQGFGTYRFHPLPTTARIRLAESPADRTTRQALEAARSFEPGRPFFLWVHYYDPHFPYTPPPEYLREGRDPYDGEVAFADTQLGVLLRELAARGLLENTVVAVTSDHGEGLGEHGEPTHGWFLYDTTLRVPLILKGPGILPRGRVHHRVRTVDLKETLVRLACPGKGEEGPEGPPGELAAFLTGKADVLPEHPVFAESLHAYDNFRWAQLTSLHRGTIKLVRGARDQYFDLSEDPGETHPMPPDEVPGRYAALAAAMDGIKEQARGPAAAAPAFQRDLPGYFGGGRWGPRPFLAEEKNRALPHPPDRAELLKAFLDAVTFQASGAVHRSRSILERVVAEDPGNPAALYWLARALRLQGDREGNPRLMERAYRCFGRVLEKDPENGDAFHMQVWCLVQLGLFQRAARAMEEWTRRHPPGAKTLELYGYLYGTRSSGGRANPLFDADRALACFDRSLALNPNNPFLLERLVGLARSLERPARAERYARELQALREHGWR